MKAFSLCVLGLFILGACNQVQGHDEREEIRDLGVVKRVSRSIYGLFAVKQQNKITDRAARNALTLLKNKSDLCSEQKRQKIKQLHGQVKDISDCVDLGVLATNITYFVNNATNLALEAGADAIDVYNSYKGCLQTSNTTTLACITSTTAKYYDDLTTLINDTGTLLKLGVAVVSNLVLNILQCLQEPSPSSVFNEINRIKSAPCFTTP